MKKVNDGLGFLYSLESKNEIVFGNASVIGKFCSFLFTLLLLGRQSELRFKSSYVQIELRFKAIYDRSSI
jgi:hypothetical protein